MAIEKRKNPARRYLYRGHRKDGKVVKDYIGPATHPLVQILARLDRLKLAIRTTTRKAAAAQRDQAQHVERLLCDLQRQTDYFYRATMLSEGYRWRRDQGWTKQERIQPVPMHPTEAALPFVTREAFDEMVARAEAGDAEAAVQLRATLRAHPELWQPLSDLTEQLKSLLMDMITGKSLVAKESLKLRIEQKTAELFKGATTPLERMVAEQVVVSWLTLHHLEFDLAQARKADADCQHLQQQVGRAEKRYFAAIEMVAKLQKLDGGDEVDSEGLSGARRRHPD